jgi:heptosyltransferase-2
MKILAIQNRMGIGDTVIFLPYLKAISQKFNSPISLLVKESSKADQYLNETDYIKEIIILDRNKNSKGKHDGILGTLDLIKELRKYKFDKVFIFNSSLRFNLIAKLSKIPIIFQYPLFKKTNQHIINTAKNFIKTNLDLQVDEDPKIQISLKSISEAIEKYKIDENNLNILLGIGGSGPTKRIPAETFLKVMEKIVDQKKCHFFLATGKDKDEQIILNQILESKFKKLCTSLDSLSIKDTLPIIKKCTFAICNDTGFGHLSAALNIKTIMLMADAPLMYGNYSSKMFPIIPDGEKTVGHSTRGKDKINPSKIYQKIQEILD